MHTSFFNEEEDRLCKWSLSMYVCMYISFVSVFKITLFMRICLNYIGIERANCFTTVLTVFSSSPSRTSCGHTFQTFVP